MNGIRVPRSITPSRRSARHSPSTIYVRNFHLHVSLGSSCASTPPPLKKRRDIVTVKSLLIWRTRGEFTPISYPPKFSVSGIFQIGFLGVIFPSPAIILSFIFGSVCGVCVGGGVKTSIREPRSRRCLRFHYLFLFLYTKLHILYIQS